MFSFVWVLSQLRQLAVCSAVASVSWALVEAVFLSQIESPVVIRAQ